MNNFSNTLFTSDIDSSTKYKRDILFYYEIQHSIFCLSFSVFYKDQNEEYPLRTFEKFWIVFEKIAVNVEEKKREFCIRVKDTTFQLTKTF